MGAGWRSDQQRRQSKNSKQRSTSFGLTKKIILSLSRKKIRIFSYYNMAKIGATFGLAFALGLLFVSFEIVSSGPGAISKREANAVEDWFEETKDSIIGGTCLTDDQCSLVSYCDHEADLKLASCKLRWWFILALAAVAFLILSSIISCLCCPCCCLYNLGKSICDCL